MTRQKQLTKQMFKDVCIFTFAEPGAMGLGGYIECITEKGERIDVCYLSDETPWEDIKKCFPALSECSFNGPMSRPSSTPEIVIHLDDEKHKETKVAPGWEHIYMGFGNHLLIRKDHYEAYSKYLSDLTEGVDIYGKWDSRAMEYIKELQG